MELRVQWLILVDPLEDGKDIAIGPSAKAYCCIPILSGPYIALPDNSGCFFLLMAYHGTL